MALDPVIVLVPVKHILARADFEPVVAFVTINLVVPARSVDHVGSGAAVTDSNATRLTVPLLGRDFSLARTRGFCESG
jgi:hypothetical protein